MADPLILFGLPRYCVWWALAHVLDLPYPCCSRLLRTDPFNGVICLYSVGVASPLRCKVFKCIVYPRGLERAVNKAGDVYVSYSEAERKEDAKKILEALG